MNREIKNAKIDGTFLGFESHGIFTCMVYLDYGGTHQGFGGYALEDNNFIKEILNVVGVEKWEDLKGKHVRADASHGRVHAIGHLLENKWFYPQGREDE